MQIYPKFHKGSENTVYLKLTGVGERITHDVSSYTHNDICLCIDHLYVDLLIASTLIIDLPLSTVNFHM